MLLPNRSKNRFYLKKEVLVPRQQGLEVIAARMAEDRVTLSPIWHCFSLGGGVAWAACVAFGHMVITGGCPCRCWLVATLAACSLWLSSLQPVKRISGRRSSDGGRRVEHRNMRCSVVACRGGDNVLQGLKCFC
jgi:hypothetical protein